TGTGTLAGIATFNSLSIAHAGEGYPLTAAMTGVTGTESAAFNVTPRAAKLLVFTVQPGAASAGATITPAVQVTARDSLGNTATSFAGTVTVAIGTNPGGGALTGSKTQTAVTGVASFPDLSIDKAGTGYTLAASSGTLTSATSSGFNILAGSVSAGLSTVTATSPITAGSGTSTITVTAKDANGNPIQGATVTLVATPTGGNTLTQPVGTTNANGVATGTLSSTTAETKTVSATINAVAITQTATVVVNPGAVSAALATVTATSPIAAGSGTSTITVTAKDANGNPIAGATVTLAVTPTAGSTLTQPVGTTDASGI